MDCIDLYVHDVAPTALSWLREHVSEDRIIIGIPPECLPTDVRYDLIYLSAVDYALDNDTIIAVLKGLQSRLTDTGEIVMISASFQDEYPIIQSLVRRFKEFIKFGFEKTGLYERGQFWGWSRSQIDYQYLMERSDFNAIQDGFIDERKQSDYWIAGRM